MVHVSTIPPVASKKSYVKCSAKQLNHVYTDAYKYSDFNLYCIIRPSAIPPIACKKSYAEALKNNHRNHMYTSTRIFN